MIKSNRLGPRAELLDALTGDALAEGRVELEQLGAQVDCLGELAAGTAVLNALSAALEVLTQGATQPADRLTAWHLHLEDIRRQLQLSEATRANIARALELIQRVLAEIGAMSWVEGRPIAFTTPGRALSPELAADILTLAARMGQQGGAAGDA
jgi:hypothetical protein